MSKYRGKKHHREAHPKIFVWSHAEKAEIEYFQEFKDHLQTARLMPKKYVTWRPQELIGYVIKWKKENIVQKDGDRVWCIFDVDSFFTNPKDKIELLNYIKLAHQNGIRIAYVNECFEVWVLLHFEKIASSIKRGKAIEQKIKNKFKSLKLGDFKKNQKVFKPLLPLQSQAISNAKSILPYYDKINWETQLGKKGNPSTSIHFLIEEIHKLAIPNN